MFNHDCGVCHTQSFEPTRRLWPANVALRSVTDEVCLRCHDGPPHHPQLATQPHCASCHQEHRGRPVLAAVADSHCTACHANLTRTDGKPSEFGNVSSFAGDHPEFALWRNQKTDPGTLRFNHQVHLKETGILGSEGKAEVLQCASCHQLDSSGRYMEPIQYEQHCARCHTLSVQVVGTWKDEALQAAAARFQKQPALHVDAATVRATMRERFMQLVRDQPAFLESSAAQPSERPLLGQRAEEQGTQERFSWVESQLRDSERMLFLGAAGCRYCHPVAQPSLAGEVPQFAEPDLPTRWLPHSRFRHDRHRMLQCSECHPAAQSQLTSDVLMPRIGTCQECHNPHVGARTDCFECHTYHEHSAHPWQGGMRIEESLLQGANRR